MTLGDHLDFNAIPPKGPAAVKNINSQLLQRVLAKDKIVVTRTLSKQVHFLRKGPLCCEQRKFQVFHGTES